jgi:hypothetical protein
VSEIFKSQSRKKVITEHCNIYLQELSKDNNYDVVSPIAAAKGYDRGNFSAGARAKQQKN